MTGPQPTWCNRCGDQFRRASDAIAHICRPNNTGVGPGDTVTIGGEVGQVLRVDRTQVQVYFKPSFQTRWYSTTDVQRVT